VHLDAGYDSATTRTTLAARDLAGQIAHKGTPAPIHASRRWPVERTHAWGNQFGKLRWCTERGTRSWRSSWRWPTRSSRWAG
jgi:hypothetical protein